MKNLLILTGIGLIVGHHLGWKGIIGLAIGYMIAVWWAYEFINKYYERKKG